MPDDVGNRGGGSIDADAQITELIGRRIVVEPAGEIAALDFSQDRTRRAQALDELREHRHERYGREYQHQRFERERGPRPAASGDLRQRGDDRKGREIRDQRAPGFAAFEVQRRLQGRDEIGAVQHMAVRAHRKQHCRNEQGADHEIELHVPWPEPRALHQLPHTGIGAGKDCREREYEPVGNRADSRQPHRDEQHDPESHEPPAGARVGEQVLALFREVLVEELQLERVHIRKR